MSHSAETNSRRPLFQAVQVFDVIEADEPPVVEEVPLDVTEAAPPQGFLETLAAVLDFDFAKPHPSAPGQVFRVVYLVGEWLFGVASLFVGLAVLAAIPVLNFLSLGYLLESGGRVARTGRLRDGFIGVRLAARLGGMALASQLCLLPVYFVADMAKAASIIDPGGKAAQAWRIGLFVLICLTFVHILAACACGGKWRYFVPPVNFISLALRIARGGYYAKARDAVWDMVMGLRLPHYFWLGFRGAVGVLAWLALPVTLMVISTRTQNDRASVLGFIGALMLAVILPYVPFLQMRLAQTNRLRAMFEIGAVRREFGRAPWAFAFAFVVTLLFALPLYLLKIQLVPREAAWLPSLVFIVFIFPARLLTGWALGRAAHRTRPRHWFFRWTGRLPFLPTAAFYVLIVFFTQFTSWDGVRDLYAQHAFLVPVPFLGM